MCVRECVCAWVVWGIICLSPTRKSHHHHQKAHTGGGAQSTRGLRVGVAVMQMAGGSTSPSGGRAGSPPPRLTPSARSMPAPPSQTDPHHHARQTIPRLLFYCSTQTHQHLTWALPALSVTIAQLCSPPTDSCVTLRPLPRFTTGRLSPWGCGWGGLHCGCVGWGVRVWAGACVWVSLWGKGVFVCASVRG